MRKVFENIDLTRVGFGQTVLEEHGIPSRLKNTVSSSLMGEVPFQEVFPELWVVDDADYDAAMKLLEEHFQAAPVTGVEWTCPACGEKVPEEFGACWNCETAAP